MNLQQSGSRIEYDIVFSETKSNSKIRQVAYYCSTSHTSNNASVRCLNCSVELPKWKSLLFFLCSRCKLLIAIPKLAKLCGLSYQN